jgi:hypothetical protein
MHSWDCDDMNRLSHTHGTHTRTHASTCRHAHTERRDTCAYLHVNMYSLTQVNALLSVYMYACGNPDTLACTHAHATCDCALFLDHL